MMSSAVTSAGAMLRDDQIAVRILVVARADMAEAIDHALVVQDAVGRHEILDQRRIGGTGGRRRGAWPSPRRHQRTEKAAPAEIVHHPAEALHHDVLPCSDCAGP